MTSTGPECSTWLGGTGGAGEGRVAPRGKATQDFSVHLPLRLLLICWLNPCFSHPSPSPLRRCYFPPRRPPPRRVTAATLLPSPSLALRLSRTLYRATVAFCRSFRQNGSVSANGNCQIRNHGRCPRG